MCSGTLPHPCPWYSRILYYNVITWRYIVKPGRLQLYSIRKGHEDNQNLKLADIDPKIVRYLSPCIGIYTVICSLPVRVHFDVVTMKADRHRLHCFANGLIKLYIQVTGFFD